MPSPSQRGDQTEQAGLPKGLIKKSFNLKRGVHCFLYKFRDSGIVTSRSFQLKVLVNNVQTIIYIWIWLNPDYALELFSQVRPDRLRFSQLQL